VRRYCFSRNVLRDLGEGRTAWKNRFGADFNGPLIPFGAKVRFKPSPIGDEPSKFQTDTRDGVFLGYALLPGGEWKGDYRVATLDDFVGMPLHAETKGSLCRVHVQRA